MKACMVSFWHSLLSSLLWISSACAGIMTVCPDAEMHQNAIVICDFGNETIRSSFGINLNRIINGYPKQEDVLLCLWRQTKHICTLSPGYDYQTNITTKAVLLIANVSLNNLGTYTCERIPSEVGHESCELKLRAPQKIFHNDQTNLWGVAVGLGAFLAGAAVFAVMAMEIYTWMQHQHSAKSNERSAAPANVVPEEENLLGLAVPVITVGINVTAENASHLCDTGGSRQEQPEIPHAEADEDASDNA